VYKNSLHQLHCFLSFLGVAVRYSASQCIVSRCCTRIVLHETPYELPILHDNSLFKEMISESLDMGCELGCCNCSVLQFAWQSREVEVWGFH